MFAVTDDQDHNRLRRRNVRMALGVGVLAIVCYVGMYVVYLMAVR